METSDQHASCDARVEALKREVARLEERLAESQSALAHNERILANQLHALKQRDILIGSMKRRREHGPVERVDSAFEGVK